MSPFVPALMERMAGVGGGGAGKWSSPVERALYQSVNFSEEQLGDIPRGKR